MIKRKTTNWLSSSKSVLNNRLLFKEWLVEQQLEEASFLYEQRRYLLDTDQLAWDDIGENENRFMRHLFALQLLAGDSDVDFSASISDSGELHTLVCLLCRQGDFNTLHEVINQADLNDSDAFNAVVDGLKWEAPESWRTRLLTLFDSTSPRTVDLLALCYGYRRWPIQPILQLDNSPLSAERIWAIGRSGGKSEINRLKQLLEGESDYCKTDASVSLLRLGSTEHLHGVTPRVHSHQWAILPFGLSGKIGIQDHLEQKAMKTPTADTLLAIGMIGNPRAVELLISHLTNDSIKTFAATSLQLITGANLLEEVFVPYDLDPDELTEEECSRIERGESPFPTGEVRGDTVERICLDPAQWNGWWKDNRSQFTFDAPYRLGKVYSPEAVVDTLESRYSSRIIRKLAYEELVIRYRVDFPFETDFLVKVQRDFLATFREWLATHSEVAQRYQATA